jgi:hypothetical protein
MKPATPPTDGGVVMCANLGQSCATAMCCPGQGDCKDSLGNACNGQPDCTCQTIIF